MKKALICTLTALGVISALLGVFLVIIAREDEKYANYEWGWYD